MPSAARPGVPVRFMVGLHTLRSDEEVCER